MHRIVKLSDTGYRTECNIEYIREGNFLKSDIRQNSEKVYSKNTYRDKDRNFATMYKIS